ncbi:MAG: ABC transporter ATP-binding protein [Planctomycetes bacterium]|nr:ABC transporter ATP-binding protein [Planctomycetota bacterium]
MTGGTLAFADVTVCYRRLPAIHHVTCALPLDGLVAVVGPNGAGKSTLLKALLGFLPLTTGSITLDGAPLAACAGRFAYLAQADASAAGFPITVEEVVAQGRYQRLGAFRGFAAADRAAVEQAIAELSLEPLRRRPFAQLSGGQRQRTLLARAVATGADIFLLDEPLTGLDAPSQHDLLARLAGWRGQRRLVLAVLHDLVAARRWCARALVLDRHLVACGEAATALAPAVLAEAFGRALPTAEEAHG